MNGIRDYVVRPRGAFKPAAAAHGLESIWAQTKSLFESPLTRAAFLLHLIRKRKRLLKIRRDNIRLAKSSAKLWRQYVWRLEVIKMQKLCFVSRWQWLSVMHARITYLVYSNAIKNNVLFKCQYSEPCKNYVVYRDATYYKQDYAYASIHSDAKITLCNVLFKY